MHQRLLESLQQELYGAWAFAAHQQGATTGDVETGEDLLRQPVQAHSGALVAAKETVAEEEDKHGDRSSLQHLSLFDQPALGS